MPIKENDKCFFWSLSLSLKIGEQLTDYKNKEFLFSVLNVIIKSTAFSMFYFTLVKMPQNESIRFVS